MTSSATVPGLEQAPTRHAKLVSWVREIAALTKPDRVEWCDGSEEEWDRLTKELAKASQININLWMGLGMLVIAVFFLGWWRLRPLRRDQPPPDATGTGQ